MRGEKLSAVLLTTRMEIRQTHALTLGERGTAALDFVECMCPIHEAQIPADYAALLNFRARSKCLSLTSTHRENGSILRVMLAAKAFATSEAL